MNELLQTKLSPPIAHQKLVARPHLLNSLNDNLLYPDGFARKLTLISAPAGYGKTTLAIEWLIKQKVAFAWLSLDENDNDPTRFIVYLIAAFRQLHNDIGVGSQAMLVAPRTPAIETILTALINDIKAVGAPIILVLDDFHVIQSASILKIVAFLLEHQPDCLHQVILSREDPPLPLHRLRARRQMLEIHQRDIVFTPEETNAFLEGIMGIEITQTDAGALNRRTEGWIAGLQLAALSLRAHPDVHAFVQSFTGSNRYVLDYLFEEVFKQQSDDVQSFLLSTSILNRLTAPLCNFITGRRDGRLQLEILEKANLFINPSDPDRRWYRYHRLFADLLRHQLHLAGEPSEKTLHRRASQWYWENDLADEAISHALAAEDWERAADLVQACDDAMLKRGEVATLLDYFGKLPTEIICARLPLCLSYAWSLMLASQFEETEMLLKRAEEAAQGNQEQLGEVAAAYAYLAQSQGDGQRLVEQSHKALAHLAKDNLTARGIVSLNLGIAYWHMGRMPEAQQALEEAYPAARQTGNTYAEMSARVFMGRTLAVRGQLRQAATRFEEIIHQAGEIAVFPLVYMDLCTLNYEWNDLEAANYYLGKSLEASQQINNIEFEIGSYMLKVRLKTAAGDPTGAQAALEQIHHLEHSSQIPVRTKARSADLAVQLALWQGDLQSAEQLASQLMPNIEAHPFYRFLGLTPARLLLAQGQRERAGKQLQLAAQAAQDNDWGYGLVAAFVLQALAAETDSLAQEFLGKALKLAQPQGYIRTFTEAGQPLAPLLQEAIRRHSAPEYAEKILATLQGSRRLTSTTTGLVESLTERELEVLGLVVAGLSNREIAGTLFLSLGTVKTHIHNLYGKLAVRNRAQAIARARELKLI